MPFYEYECSNCRFYVEVLQKISDQPLKKCPSCGKNALKKLVSAPVFRLKGSGWYETDFKSDQENKRNLAGAEKEESSSDKKTEGKDASTDSKAESKGDAKSDAKESVKDAKGAKSDGKVETKTAKASPGRRGTGGAGSARTKPSSGPKSAKRPAASSRKPAAKRRRGR
jgi:putative FmdB family regulatory protein